MHKMLKIANIRKIGRQAVGTTKHEVWSGKQPQQEGPASHEVFILCNLIKSWIN